MITKVKDQRNKESVLLWTWFSAFTAYQGPYKLEKLTIVSNSEHPARTVHHLPPWLELCLFSKGIDMQAEDAGKIIPLNKTTLGTTTQQCNMSLQGALGSLA